MPSSRPRTNPAVVDLNVGDARAPTQRSRGMPTAISPEPTSFRSDLTSGIRQPPTHTPELTHSTSTSANVSKAASKLVRAGEEEWSSAEVRLGCFLAFTAVINIHDNEAFTRELIYPNCIKEQECIDLVDKFEKRKQAREGAEAVFEPTYTSWVRSLHSNRFQEQDVYVIRDNLRTFILFWQDHENANARQVTREAEIRSGVDWMIKVAFECRDEAIHVHRLETDLFLPAAPWVAKADNVCMIDLPVEWVDFLRKLPNKHIFCSDDNAFSVVTFICEDKVKEHKQAARQLTLDMCSAQHQRRALGFEDSKIFGATLVDTEMRFFASEWEGDNVHVFLTTKCFDLKSFGQYLSCYIFLCRLADLEASNIRSTFDMWQSEKDKQKLRDHNIAESQKEPWRPVAPPSASGSKKRKPGEDEEKDDMESVFSSDQEEFEGDAGGDITEVRTEDEEQVPHGGLSLSKLNLRALDYLSRAKRTSGPPKINDWARNSAASCDGAA